MNIILCTESDLKYEAVKAVYPEYNVVKTKSNSDIPNQPFGRLEITMGTINRYTSVNPNKESENIYISIENGLIQNSDHLFDIGVVRFAYKQETIIEHTEMIIVDCGYVYDPEVTWGDYLHSKDTSIDPKNPHTHLGNDRKDMLIKALKVGKTKICHYIQLHNLDYYAFKGIDKFYDITQILSDPKLLDFVVTKMTELISIDVDYIAGIEARGFIFGPLVAHKLNKPFVMVRKAGKYPNSIESDEYETEYSKDRICISKSLDYKDKVIVLIDDIIATGGTFLQSKKLFESQGAIIMDSIAIIDLECITTKPGIYTKSVVQLN